MSEQIDNTPPSDEQDLSRSTFHDFLTLSETEAQALKNRIVQSNGLARVFVHPFFVSEESYLKEIDKQKIRSIDHSIARMMQMGSSQTPPIMFLEEEEKIDLLKERLKHGNNEAYIIPTYTANPLPKLSTDGPANYKGWDAIIDKLKEAGVETIILGGMKLWIKMQEYYPHQGAPLERVSMDFYNCVGTTFQNLSTEFQVDVSGIAFPDSRVDLTLGQKRIEDFQKNKELAK